MTADAVRIAWTPRADPARRHRVVIVGGGFAGLAAARALAGAPVDLTLIDQHNYHLFQPLLYQVATAGLSPADIATPIRSILRDQRNTRVLLGAVQGVDKLGRAVLLHDGRVPYDTLVLATGARHSYFGRDHWEVAAPGLKKIEDATRLRHRLLVAFERAEMSDCAEERRRLLNFIVVGGGPTGVELAGAIAELANVALARDFRRIDPRSSRIILVHSGNRLLPTFPPPLSAYAARALYKLGVEVRLGHPATACDVDGVIVAGERLEARTIVWAAGVSASPAGQWLGAQTNPEGRVLVRGDLSLPQHPEIFVIGDTAFALSPNAQPYPGVASVAKQQGEFVGQLVAKRVAGHRSSCAFRYRRYGNMATIGRKKAVAELRALRFHGRIAWLLWGGVHILFLIGFRNRIAVMLNWLWAYVTFHQGARLITGESP
ncbi:MAG TPA: NAD(P)/FAD-dependent oxidoreductase [Caulobacteraceae bacterium]|nr:NAD(P)/FAD-dependent oxidoreductase [Caulobacteraceae bacterium]